MPKKTPGIKIRLDLLKPQGENIKIFTKASKWLLSTGRYIIIFVEALVLVAFLSRFKFDADLATTKEAIDQQVPFIQSQKTDEELIRQVQMQLATIKDIKLTSPDYHLILNKIAQQTPTGVRINNITLNKGVGKVDFKITGSSQTNNDLTTFILGLKEEVGFEGVTISSIGLEEDVTNFTITGSNQLSVRGERSL